MQSSVPNKRFPSSPSAAIKECDADLYPNIHVLLQIACTILVTSCESKRSAGAFRLHEILCGKGEAGQSSIVANSLRAEN